jgi:transcriptional regulator with XRE-family HTH domain
VTTKAKKIARLTNKEYRDAFVGAQINVGLPFQLRALREQRKWKQADVAEKTGMLQPRISAMERPGGTKFTLETLRRLASAFDVGLLVKFVPFSELVQWSDDFNAESFAVPSFDEDCGLKEPPTSTDSAVAGLPTFIRPQVVPQQFTGPSTKVINIAVYQKSEQIVTDKVALLTSPRKQPTVETAPSHICSGDGAPQSVARTANAI